MPKTKISEFSSTPANNTDIDSINIAEGCAPSGINDAIRELMAQLKDFQAGTAGDPFNGATAGAHNGTVGATTPAAGTFTTLASTGNTTLGDAAADTVTVNGTANFVAAPTIGGVGLGMGFKNRIINGAMVIDQRNAGASITQQASSTFSVDRWSVFGSVTSKFSIQQNAGSVTPPIGFTKYIGATSLSSYSVGASEIYIIQQVVEGFNISDFNWGTANAVAITVSFRVYSSLTGTFGGVITNGGSTRSYPFSFSISSANTWTTVSIPVVGDTSGTWATDNTAGLKIIFSLGSGASVSGAAGAWAGAAYFSATGATSVVGTNGATFYITGVQLEKGSTATSFDYRPYGTELALAKRYYQVLSDNSRLSGMAFNASVNPMWWPFDVQMRATPSPITLSGVGTSTVLCGGSNLPLTSIASTGGSLNGCFFDANTGGGGTAGFGTQLRLVGSTISASAEL